MNKNPPACLQPACRTDRQTAAEKCVAAGVRGILNFAPVHLNLPAQVPVRNVFVDDDLRSLLIKLGEQYEKSV